MIWIRRLLLLFAGLLLGTALLLAGVVAFFDAADYKRTAAWIADHFFDTELVIGGTLTVRLGENLLVNVSDIALNAHDGSYRFSSKALQADVRLRPLLTGTLWLNDLEVKQFFLKVNESTTPPSDSSTPGMLLPVVIARANVQDLVVEYQELPPGTLHTLSLDDLRLDDAADAGPVSIQANGVFEDQPFEISGTLPAIDEVLDDTRPKPVELVLTGNDGQLKIAGMITDLMHGKGLELRLELATRATRLLLELLGDDIPEVGELHVTALMRGDYDAPRLEEIDASLKRGADVDISAHGSVDDIYSGAGLMLHIKGQSKQPDVVSWLLFGKLGQVSSLEFSGTVEEQDGHIYMTGVDAAARTPKGLSVTAQGKALIYDREHLFLQTDTGLNTTFSAPTTAAVNLFNVAGIPELGAVRGRFKLLLSTDAMGVYDADLSIGSKGDTAARLQGQISDIPLAGGDAGATGVKLQLAVESPDVTVLADKFGYVLPAIGSGKASMEVTGDLDNLKLKRVKISTADSNLLLAATGNIDKLVPGRTVTVDNALFDVTASTPDLSRLSTLAGTELPKLGPASMSSTMTFRKSDLVFSAMKVTIGEPAQPAIQLQGKVTTQLHKGSTIQFHYNVPVADLVAAYRDKKPGYLGRFEGAAELSDIDGSWGIEKFTLVSSQTSLYRMDIHGGIDDLKNNDKVSINVDFELTDPSGFGNALGIDLSWLKPYREQGLLASKQDALVYNGKMSVGKTSGTTAIHSRKHTSELFDYSGNISIPLLDLTDFGFRLEQDAANETIAKPGSSGKDYLFSREPLQVGFLNSFGLDLQINIEQIESYGEYSIDSVAGHVSLQNGELRVDPLHLIYAGGTMDIVAGVHATGTPVYTLKVVADDLILGPMMAQVMNSTPITGRTNVYLDLASSGGSVHELASNLNGNIRVELENARIPKIYVEYLSVDVFGWALSNTFATQKGYANLNCVMTDFTADNGKLKSKLLVADGPNLSIGGRIDFNLRDETIDAVLLPKQKRPLFSSITPVRLSGPIRDPNVQAIPAKAAIKEIGTLALGPTIYLSTRLLEKIWSTVRSGGDVGEGCTNVDKMTDEAEKAKKTKKTKPAIQRAPASSYLLSD